MNEKIKEEKNKKSKKTFWICFIIITILVITALGYYLLYINREPVTKLENYFSNIWQKSITNEPSFEKTEETSIENEKLVLKDNYGKIKEKIIIYSFENDILFEVRIIETYDNKEEYDKQKEYYKNNSNIEIIGTNEQELVISYKKFEFGSDNGLSYKQIYNKYMGIIGAYEII